MKFLDCNCSYGRHARPSFRYAATAQELLDEMDFCGIDGALVHHANMRFAWPMSWNQVLSEEVKNQSRLQATWAILPPQTGELPAIEEFLRAMNACHIRALWAFPQEHHYCLDSLTFGPLFEAMKRLRIPLLAKDNLLSIKTLLKEQPGLIVVAMNQGPHSQERCLRPMIDAYPDLYLDTSCLIVDGLIEEFCRRYGPDRLLFGSGFPNNCSGAALLRVAQADVDSQARQAIAAGNLERLLREVRL